jgi:predicted component of type VI protein secretion system
MYAAGSKIDLDSSLRLQILRIKRDFLLLLLPPGFNQQRVAKIVVMKMKRRLVVSVSIGLDDLSVGDSCILDENVYIRTSFSIGPAYEPFDRKPMVGFMRRSNDRRETAHYSNGQDPFPPS